jgi:hypothetical protein
MFKVKIINRMWLKSGEYGEFSERWQAELQMVKYAIQSDADKWEFDSSEWKAYLDGVDTPVLTMEVMEAT